jgi:putative DNA primase/helicase
MCSCPAHEDENPSLHVSDGQKGVVVVKCHARCSQEHVLEALRSKGIWLDNRWSKARQFCKPDKIEDEERERKETQKAWAIMRAAHYAKAGPPLDYLQSRGITIDPWSAKLLPAEAAAQLEGVIKMPDKFRDYPAMVVPGVNSKGLRVVQVTWLDRDCKSKLCGDARRNYGILKGAYVVLGDYQSDQPLIMAEGVETALSASQIAGVPAIATLGATNMRAVIPPQCSEVIICPDNDKPGLEAAQETARRLSVEGRKVRIAQVPEPDNDWNDTLQRSQQADLDDLRHSILHAELFEGPQGVQALTMEQFLNVQFPRRDHLIKPWLETGALVMIAAQRGDGKTLLALSAAYALATGKNLMDWLVSKSVRVLYIDGELPGELLKQRLAMLGPNTANLLVVSRDQFNNARRPVPDLTTPEGQAFINGIIERNQIDVIFLDSVSTLFRSGVENEAESWVPVQNWLMDLRWQNRSVVLIHHEGRSGNPRGTSKREDVLDTIIKLKKNHEQSTDTDSVFDFSFTKSRSFYGADAAARVLRVSTASSVVTWQSGCRESRAEEVGRLLDEGMSEAEIADHLGISRQAVNKAKQRRRS